MAKKRGPETRAGSAETGTLAGEGAESSSGVVTARGAPSQLMELFLHVCAALGAEDARDVAAIADVSPENVANWRSGAVREFKPQKLEAAKRGLELRIRALRARARESHGRVGGLAPLEIEAGSGPAELQRQFRDSVPYDYLGHRFLYFDAQGALAWERVLSTGYDQDAWLHGLSSAATAWLDPSTRPPGPLAAALGLDRRTRPRGLDVVSLGPGEGTKETLILQAVRDACESSGLTLPWLAYAPVDVSIPLLLRASAAPRARDEGRPPLDVLAFCADFEEGPLEFASRLPTTTESDGLRLVLMLGNVFGTCAAKSSSCAASCSSWCALAIWSGSKWGCGPSASPTIHCSARPSRIAKRPPPRRCAGSCSKVRIVAGKRRAGARRARSRCASRCAKTTTPRACPARATSATTSSSAKSAAR